MDADDTLDARRAARERDEGVREIERAEDKAYQIARSILDRIPYEVKPAPESMPEPDVMRVPIEESYRWWLMDRRYIDDVKERIAWAEDCAKVAAQVYADLSGDVEVEPETFIESITEVW